jgi:transcriptional regulator with XRE-family HTH domain
MLGLTQGQLGERLNMSAQAVSKWENDLAEPDLTTLKALANLYSVSLDELLDTDADVPQNAYTQGASGLDSEKVAKTIADALDDKMKENPKTVGFCKRCGIVVTAENLGEESPVVLCKNCVEHQKAQEAAQDRARKAAALEQIKKDEARKSANAYAIKKRRTLSFVVAGIIAAIFFILLISGMTENFDFPAFLIGIFLTYAIFSFVCMLFYDTAVSSVLVYMCSASIKFPGLIFTFDLDGFIWLIAMKLLFAVLGFLFGLVCTVLGVVLGIVIAPFVFPYIMVKLHREIVSGVESEYAY